jgi:ABC-type multidrug transport system ATPase subunit
LAQTELTVAAQCDTQPDSAAVGVKYGECKVSSPTFSALFAGDMRLTMTKVAPSGAGEMGALGLGTWPAQAGTTLTQLWLDGIEQFYCQASGCVNSNVTESVASTAKFGTSDWACSNLQCHCISSSKICSPDAPFGIGKIIAGQNGSLSMPCDYADPNDENATTQCAFKSQVITSTLGEGGLSLTECSFGSCLSQQSIQNAWYDAAQADPAKSGGVNLSGGVIGGLAVLGVFLAGIAAFVVYGIMARRRAAARLRKPRPEAFGLRWDSLHFQLPNGSALQRFTGVGAAVVRKRKAYDEEHEMSQIARDKGRRSGHILRGVSGEAPPGGLTAIMGASGAGKTTLVEILSGKNKRGTATGGLAYVSGDGTVLPSAPPSDCRVLCFVDQEDHLPPHSTVREALSFAAELANPENVTAAERAQIVDDTIATLGLGAVAGALIGDRKRRGLSGGEKRRVSIGIAAVARPSILVLDEPLSGLDSLAAMQVMQALRAMASGPRSGTTVIMTLHQPSFEIFEMPNKIMVMAHGETVFDAAPFTALTWCRRRNANISMGQNVADVLIKICSEGAPSTGSASNSISETQQATGVASSVEGSEKDEWRQRVGTAPDVKTPGSPGAYAVNMPIVGPRGPLVASHGATPTTLATQMRALVARQVKTAKRDPTGPLAHILGSVAIGLFVGGAFFQIDLTIAGFQNRIGSLFFVYILMTFASLSATVGIDRARPLMERERAAGHYHSMAWLATYLAYDLLLLRAIPAVLLATIVYWMVGLHPSAQNFFQYLLVSVVYAAVAGVFSALLGVIAADLSVAVLLAGLNILFNIAFGESSRIGCLLDTRWVPAVMHTCSALRGAVSRLC